MRENYLREDKKGINIEASVFKLLIRLIIENFEFTYKLDSKQINNYQLFGYNNFDESQPSIKRLIFEKTGIWANGKYLYNKKKELEDGAKNITLRREYEVLYFNAIGFKNIYDFITNNKNINEEIANVQFEILGQKQPIFEYYLIYYLGENNNFIKAKFIIKDWKEFDFIMYYWESVDTPSLYQYSKGKPSLSKSGYSISFSKEHSNVHQDAFINIYTGNLNVLVRPYMLGAYLAFDKNNCPVVGEMIFEKMKSEHQLDEMVNTTFFPNEIKAKLTGRRLIIENRLPESLKNIDSIDIDKILTKANNYDGKYLLENEIENLKLDLFLDQNNFKAISSKECYEGKFHYYNATNLIFEITTLNNQLYFGQIQFFIGRKNKLNLKSIKGVFMYINDELQPKTIEIILNYIQN